MTSRLETGETREPFFTVYPIFGGEDTVHERVQIITIWLSVYQLKWVGCRFESAVPLYIIQPPLQKRRTNTTYPLPHSVSLFSHRIKTRARIFKLLRRPRIDSKEPIPPAYIAWRAGTTTLFLLGS